MSFSEAEIPGPSGGLEARVARGTSRGGVVVCHPHPAFGGRMDNPLVVRIAHACADRALHVARFNFRGIGASDGQPTGGHQEHEDVAAVVEWMSARCERVAVIGYSFGALMTLKAVGLGLRPHALVSVGFPTTLITEERRPLVEAGLPHCPHLFLSGDADQFSEIPVLEQWKARTPTMTLEVSPGEGHFFAGPVAVRIAERARDFALGYVCPP